MIESLGGKKFVFGMVIAIMVFALTVLKIEHSEFLSTIMVIYGLFVGGDVVSKFSPVSKIEANDKNL